MSAQKFFTRGTVGAPVLAASVAMAVLSILGLLVVPARVAPVADLHLEPRSGTVVVGETFQVTVRAKANQPVNVFSGELSFDPAQVVVEAIDYNVSIADLWAEKPWYENGAGTINFVGGTTRPGGFTGEAVLLTITFRTLSLGEARVHIHDARILAHDGLGSDVPLSMPLDGIFAVTEAELDAQTVALPHKQSAHIVVLTERRVTDLNEDGKQSLADVSIFMRGLFDGDARFDFNKDGSVDTKDLSILMSAP